MSRFGRDRSPDERLESSSPVHAWHESELEIVRQSGHRAGASDHDAETADARINDRGVGREHSHSIGESDVKTLTDIGTFRALAFADLAHHRYGGDLAEARNQLRRLSHQGLVRSRTIYPDRTVYVTLTRAGHRLIVANRERENPRQRLYHGFVKTREARHDTALYPLYRQESARIERMGGSVRRVVLDFELKQSVNRRLARLKGQPEAEQAHERQQIAQDHGLRVVGGKIPLPDLRLEYEGPDQQLAKVDLELVTSHYRHHNLAAKAQAGFALYAFADDAVRLRPAMQDPEIMQDILSL